MCAEWKKEVTQRSQTKKKDALKSKKKKKKKAHVVALLHVTVLLEEKKRRERRKIKTKEKYTLHGLLTIRFHKGKKKTGSGREEKKEHSETSVNRSSACTHCFLFLFFFFLSPSPFNITAAALSPLVQKHISVRCLLTVTLREKRKKSRKQTVLRAPCWTVLQEERDTEEIQARQTKKETFPGTQCTYITF